MGRIGEEYVSYDKVQRTKTKYGLAYVRKKVSLEEVAKETI